LPACRGGVTSLPGLGFRSLFREPPSDFTGPSLRRQHIHLVHPVAVDVEVVRAGVGHQVAHTGVRWQRRDDDIAVEVEHVDQAGRIRDIGAPQGGVARNSAGLALDLQLPDGAAGLGVHQTTIPASHAASTRSVLVS